MNPFDQLTPRERQVAKLLALGETNRQIASELAISVKTVDTHRARVLAKLECRNNVDLARISIRWGLVDPVTPVAIENSAA